MRKKLGSSLEGRTQDPVHISVIIKGQLSVQDFGFALNFVDDIWLTVLFCSPANFAVTIDILL